MSLSSVEVLDLAKQYLRLMVFLQAFFCKRLQFLVAVLEQVWIKDLFLDLRVHVELHSDLLKKLARVALFALYLLK